MPRVEGGRPKRTLALAFAALAGFVLCREAVRRLIPDVDKNLWLVDQLLLTGPRLAAVALLWLLVGRPASFEPVRPRVALLGCSLACLAWLLYFRSSAYVVGWAAWQKAAGTVVSVGVALFEEYAWRGLILGALASLWKPQAAALASSLLFTAFHFRAQSPDHWPIIFLTGQLFAELRLAGTPLWALMLTHAAIDSAWFWVDRGYAQPFSAMGAGALLVLFGATFAAREGRTA